MENIPVHVLMTVPFPEVMVEKIRQAFPRLELTLINTHRSEDISPEIWHQTEILYTDRVLPEADQAPNLRWIQFHYAGIEFLLENPISKREGLIMTHLSGGAAPQMGEYILMTLLALGHHLPAVIHNQAKAEWPRDRWEKYSPLELRGSTVGIVGYGSIGREAARLLQNLDVKVLAIKRDVMHPADSGYIPEGMGDPEGNYFTRLYPVQAMASMLKECDFVIVCLPLTAATRNLIGKEHLEAMKSTAYLVVIGRGAVIEQQALIDALQDRKIAGAALDTFPEEPLPPNSPFWKLSNVMVTPHISGISTRYDERAMELFALNLKRYLNDSPLLNRFDPELGY